MNFKTATKEQLLQVALNEKCDPTYKFKSCRQLQIKFTVSKHRKCGGNKFNPKLSNYWQSVYKSIFRSWK